MKRLVILLSVILYWTIAIGQVSEYRQDKIDALLDEYELLRGKTPYVKASNRLQDAALQAAWGRDHRDEFILRYAQLEYNRRYNINFSDVNFEKHLLREVVEKYEKLPAKQRSFGLTLIYVQLQLYRLPYLHEQYLPHVLMEMFVAIDREMPLTIEPELAMYYELLDMKINEETRKDLLKELYEELADYDGRYWADAAFVAYLNEKPSSYVDKCLQLAEKTNKPAADAVRAYIKEATYDRSVYDEQAIYQSYLEPAKQGSVLACTRLARNLIDQDRKDEAKEILQSVENDPYFVRYGGTIYKANLLSESDELSDLQDALQLYLATMDSCYIDYQRKNAKKKYNECQNKVAFLQLEQQEEMLDYDDATIAELTALAKGYETYDKLDKAMSFYRLAAEMGDLYSVSKIALYDMKQGISTQNEAMTTAAARTIVENSNSWFSPFSFNAFVITLFGLDGNAPDKAKAKKYYKSYLKKLKEDAMASDYVKDDFLMNTGIIEDDEDLEDFIAESDEVLEEYNEGLAYEARGEYKDAWYCYQRASWHHHPLARTKMDTLDKRIKW